MNLPFYFAFRYLKSKKSHNAINIISFVSLFGIAASVAVMVIVMSAFNGLEQTLATLYNSFDSPIKIKPSSGKVFALNDSIIDKIKTTEGIISYSQVLEETVILQNEDRAVPATIKGVEESYLQISRLDTLFNEGKLELYDENDRSKSLIGYDLFAKLGIQINHKPLHILTPIRDGNIRKIKNAFNEEIIDVGAVFSVAPEYDSKYIITPIEFTRKLLQYDNEISAIEIDVKKNKEEEIKNELQEKLGKKFLIQTRYEKNKLIYQTNQTEKWLTFSILSFVLIIAAFNIMASLSMLILDKKKDIKILSSMGGNKSLIGNIFFIEGLLINILGGISGLVIGISIIIIQQKFGIVALEGMVTEYFPVELNFIDIITICITILIIGTLSSYLPVKYLMKRYFQ